MKKISKFFPLVIIAVTAYCTACSSNDKKDATRPDPVAANIKMYTHVWDEIVNRGRLELFNDSNFTKDVRFRMKPADVVGIDSARAYYANFINGFSGIEFSIKDVFGQDNKLVKHWEFKGKHTGTFFGIPATGKMVDIEGATLVKMLDGKIEEEQDFFDNADLMTQLGLMKQ